MKLQEVQQVKGYKNQGLNYNKNFDLVKLKTGRQRDVFIKNIDNNSSVTGVFQRQISFSGLNDYEIEVDFNDPKSVMAAAEKLYTYDDKHLMSYIERRSRRKNKSAESILLSYVKQVRKKMEDLPKEISDLGIIIAGDSYNTTEQKKDVAINFFKFVEAEKRGMDIDVPNGIMLYGDSEKGIDELTKWIKDYGDLYVEELDFDSQNASDSIAKMYDSAKMAENLYQISGKRTLLHIKNLDELLTNQDTIKDRIRIGKFKSFIEYVSKKYHTTILMETTKPLDAFEEASIGDQRFNLKIRVKNRQATEDEVKRYDEAKIEYERIQAVNRDFIDANRSFRQAMSDAAWLMS